MNDPAFLPPLLAGPVGVALGAVGVLWIYWRERTRRRAAELANRQSTAQLRTLTEFLHEGVIAYGLDHEVQFANAAFVALTGHTAEGLRDLHFLEYIHPDDRQPLLAEWERLDRGETIVGQEYRVVTRDGQIKWSASSWRSLLAEDGRQIGYLGTELDITERKRVEHELRMDVDLFQAVMEVQQAVVSAGLDSRTVMSVIAERAHALTHADSALIEILEGEDLAPKADTGSPTGAPRVETSLSGVCIRTGEVQRCDDTANDRRVDPDVTRRLGIRSLLAVPLRAEGRVLGVLKVISSKPDAFTDRDVRALKLMARLMGASLEHAAFMEGRQSRLEERTQSLQDSEQRFKQLVDAAQEGIWVLDERDVTTYLNQRMADLLNQPKGEVLGRSVYDFVDSAGRAAAREALAHRESGTAARSDIRFRRADGSDLWGMVSTSPLLRRDGAHVGTVAMVTDVTERRRAEERLRRSAERLAMLHEVDQAVLAARSPVDIARGVLGRLRRMMPSGWAEIVVFDTARDEAQLLAGYDAGRSLPSTTAPLASFGTAEVRRRGVAQCVNDLTELEDPTPRFRRLLDAGVQSLISAPLLVEGEVLGDITIGAGTAGAFNAEHREIVQEVAAPLAVAVQHARLRDELARRSLDHERRLADRGAAVRELTGELDGLLGGLAHEVRAPIRQMHGFATLLVEEIGPRPDAAGRRTALRIREAAARLGRLIDDLVHFARVARQDILKQPTDVGDLVRDVVSRMQAELNGRVVEWRVGQFGIATCDPALLKIAVGHLVTNALKFARPGSEPRICIQPIDAEGQAGIAVGDNGIGFDPAHISKLFTLFERLHRSDEADGNGVGLAVVRRIAERHGGRTWATAEPGSGATFYLTLGAPWTGR